jgi:DNA-binding CsgD family transcriptional regulator
MNDKNTSSPVNNQQLPAGLMANDHNIEFVGNTQDKTVIWMQRGNSHPFKNLPSNIYKSLEELFLTDHQAVKFLCSNYGTIAHDLKRLTELYTYYMYGQLDSTPDVIQGQLQSPENFREQNNCPSLQFSNKYIDINGVHLSPRDIIIIDDMIEGSPDKLIAHNLGIAHSTFDFHKRNLFKKLNIQSKTQLIIQCFKNKVAV